MTGDAERHKSRKIAACLLVIALGAGVRWVELNRLSSFRDRDEIGYALVVRSLADGDLAGLAHPTVGPGVILPAIAAYPLAGDSLRAGRWSGFAAGLALLAVFFVLVCKVCGLRVALIAGLIAATDRNLVVHSTAFLTESHFTTWLLGALLILYSSKNHLRPRINALLTGALLGVSFLCRPEGFIYGVVLVPVVMVATAPRSSISWQRAVLAVVGFALVASPYFAGMRVVTGRWQFNGRIARARTIGEAGQDRGLFSLIDDNSDFRSHAAEFNAEFAASLPREGFDPLKKLIAVLRNSQDLAMRMIIFLPPLYVLLLGAALGGASLSRGGWRMLAAVLWLTLPILLLILSHNTASRHFLPLVPFAIAGAAVGIRAVAERIKSAPLVVRSLLHPVVLTTAVCAFNLAVVMMDDTGKRIGVRQVHHDMAAWIDEHLPQDSIILDYHAYTTALADRYSFMVPYAEYDRFCDYANHKGATHLLLESDIMELRPQLQFLFDQRGDEYWGLIHEDGSADRQSLLFEKK